MQYITALNKMTGETVWRTDRTTAWNDLEADGKPRREGDFRKAFSTPVVFDMGGKLQMITVGSTAAFSYDPLTGRELWKTHFPGHSVAVRPVFGNGLVFLQTGRDQPAFWAIKPDGEGEVTDTHVVWKTEEKIVPTEPSPLLVDDLLYLVSNDGIVTCLESLTGQQVWSQRVGGNCLASPIYADGRIYVFSLQGKTTVLKAGREFEVLATSELDDGFMASPAVMGRALILRTKTNLYRIESSTP